MECWKIGRLDYSAVWHFSIIPTFHYSKNLKSEICVFFKKFVKLLSSEHLSVNYHFFNVNQSSVRFKPDEIDTVV